MDDVQSLQAAMPEIPEILTEAVERDNGAYIYSGDCRNHQTVLTVSKVMPPH